YEIWPMQSAFHNLPTFGDVMRADGAAFAARDVRADILSETAEISFDMAAAYPQEARLRAYRRTVSLRRGHCVEITDDHDGDLPAVLSLMICDEPVVYGGSVHVGELGRIEIQGGGNIEID